MSAHAMVLKSAEYRRMRWKNGGGWTSEIWRVPDQDDWMWRLSIAEVEQDGAFSAYPGVDRELVLLGGQGLRLRFADGHTHQLMPPFSSLRFAGEQPIVGELLDGPTRDFNLMWQRDRVDARLWHRPVVGMMAVFVEPGETWVVHLLQGHLSCDGIPPAQTIAVGDTLLLGADGQRARYALDGQGELLVARVAPLPARM